MESSWKSKITKEQLFRSLEELVKLQSHYAELLNMHDGGERHPFKDAEEWIKRVKSRKMRGIG